MNKCAIVIPIYKECLSESEILSLNQCFKILGNYPIIFICQMSLDIGFYENFCKLKNIEFRIQQFDDKYFKGLAEYSKLLLDVNFYKQFIDYEYILIYQLDAWVFKDKLIEWCDKGYDYIGAPWFEGYDKPEPDAKLLPEAGNGGFSLRKVSSIIKTLSLSFPMKYAKNWRETYDTFKKRHLISNVLNIPILLWKRYGIKNLAYFFFKDTQMYEDFVFAKITPRINKNFKVATPKEAMFFSFEVNPSKLYEMSHKTLPFGCHAWEKYEPEFWTNFINSEK